MKLKEFQMDSVFGVLEGLSTKNGVFALADEVGLGKTLVCAEAACRLIKKSKTDNYILFYVAPSLELLDQNIKSIGRYFVNQLDKDKYDVYPIKTRISKLPYDLSQHGNNKTNIYLIGLSPETSFNMRGAGLKEERAYLAALFGKGYRKEWKNFLRNFFWCIPNKNSDLNFKTKIETLSNSKSLGALLDWRSTDEFKAIEKELIAFKKQKIGFANSQTRALIAKVRRLAVAHLIEARETLPKFIIFDEWHKYKHTCFESRIQKKKIDHLVGKLLVSCRRSKGTKVLFVSATPFTVDYNEMQGDLFRSASSDLKDLLRLFWEPKEFEKKHQKLEQLQTSFVRSIQSLLKNEDFTLDPKLKTEADVSRKEYETELRRYCVRTERPKVPVSTSGSTRPAKWDDVFEEESLKEFLKKYKGFDGIRTPITAMWMDGHAFPEAGYEGLKHYKVKNIKKKHWKFKELIKLLNEDFQLGDQIHSFLRPPLWITPTSPLRGRKHLIFSEFKFVPDEICHKLKKCKFGTAKKASGSILGFFPLANKTSLGKLNLQKSINFPMFYPFLFWELDQVELSKKIKRNELEIKKIIENSKFAVRALLDIEKLLVHNSALEDAHRRRRRFMDENLKIVVNSRFKEFLGHLIFGSVGDFCPGRAVAEVVKSLRLPEQSNDNFERSTLELAQSVFHVLVSPEAQELKNHSRFSKETNVPHTWNSFLKFALWYCDKYKLKETLLDFSELLKLDSKRGSEVLSEIISAMSLRRGSVGTRFVRSFHDRKAEKNLDESKEGLTTKSIRAAFNSPFPPYVLASTSVGQEGLDFHRYCDSIIHWNPPSSPSTLRQREGRLDRFRSLQVRIAEKSSPGVQNDDLRGLNPDFVVMKNNIRINQPKVKVFFLPFTSQAATWKRCLERMHYDDLLIGAPDPIADEKLWLEVMGKYSETERQRRLALLRQFSISLNPKSKKKNR